MKPIEASPPEDHELRQYNRYACDWPAQCTIRSASPVAARIVDASEGGFRVSADCDVRIGEVVALELDQIGAFLCKVRWTEDKIFGVQILEMRNQLAGEQAEILARSLDLVDSDDGGLIDRVSDHR